MEITIHYSTKTGTLKQAFSRMFPYLKIEFLKNPSNTATISWNNNFLHNRYVGEINEGLRQGSISISSEHKTDALVQLFQENFGLPVLVFRKQKNTWIETSKEEALTLAEQNEIGKESCLPVFSINLGVPVAEAGRS